MNMQLPYPVKENFLKELEPEHFASMDYFLQFNSGLKKDEKGRGAIR
jgi:hypothetical protein